MKDDTITKRFGHNGANGVVRFGCAGRKVEHEALKSVS
jgi:hypothetical protein